MKWDRYEAFANGGCTDWERIESARQQADTHQAPLHSTTRMSPNTLYLCRSCNLSVNTWKSQIEIETYIVGPEIYVFNAKEKHFLQHFIVQNEIVTRNLWWTSELLDCCSKSITLGSGTGARGSGTTTWNCEGSEARNVNYTQKGDLNTAARASTVRTPCCASLTEKQERFGTT